MFCIPALPAGIWSSASPAGFRHTAHAGQPCCLRRVCVGGGDLYQLRFRGYRALHMGVHLGRVAGRIGAGIVLRCDALEKQRVVPGAFGAVMAGTRLGHKRCILFRERRGGKFQKDIMLDPFAQMANGKQNALRLAAARIALLPASGQRFLLLL